MSRLAIIPSTVFQVGMRYCLQNPRHVDGMAGSCLNIVLERHVLVMMLKGFHRSIHRPLSQWATILVVTIV
jgi:hypothetical protein